MKKLRTLLTLLMVSVCSWHAAWAQEEETTPVRITVSLATPGSLSTEVMSQLNQMGKDKDLKIVNELIVENGTFDADDWTAIQSMTELQVLDLLNITNTEVPEDQFNGKCPKLQTITLPKNLRSIGENAFRYNEYISVISLPETMQEVGEYAFMYCSNLQTINWPASITTIPEYCFDECKKLEPFQIPEGVTSIGRDAFYYCSNFTSSLPSTLKSIGESAFARSNMQNVEVTITDDMTLENGAFYYTNIKSIDFGSKFYKAGYWSYAISHCANLQDIYFRSPTVVIESSSPDEYNGCLAGSNRSVKIHVPSYLASSYSGHTYWSQFTIESFDESTVNKFIVNDNLTLKGHMRISGTPNMEFNPGVQLLINDGGAQAFGDLVFNTYRGSWSYSDSHVENYWKPVKVISECSNVTMNGNLTYRFSANEYEKRWFFLTMPFDFKVSDITTDNDVKFAIRYYDGARRATNNSDNGNWTDFADDAVVKAGTGFIIQTSKETIITFKAQANASRNNMFKNEALETSLAPNVVEGTTTAAHKGWNFVGNPWQCYYNIHRMNYTAPISVYEGNSYTAYSPADDDLALAPSQAFFVQCPDEITKIGFPIEGRQMTNEITEGSRTRSGANADRRLLDIRVENGERGDRTRLVVNEAAQMAYEIGRDASKFMVTDSDVPQIYSIDAEGTQYAINERPADNGTLRLGIFFPAEGSYQITAVRNDIGSVILTDLETNIKTDLSKNAYSFEAKQGTADNRFTVSITRGIGGEGDGTTGIEGVESQAIGSEVFTLDGQKVANTTNGLKKGVYVIRQGEKTKKVIIK